MSFETRLRTSEGAWIWVEATMTLQDNPLVGGLVANFRDITERRAEEARREAVAEFGLWALRSAPLADLLRRAAGLLVEFLQADAATVFERMTTPDDQVVARAWAGWPQSLVGILAPAPPSSPMGKTLATGSHYLVTEYCDEPWFPGKELIEDSGSTAASGR